MTEDRNAKLDITGTTLQVLFIAILVAAGFWTVRPFLKPFIWAVIIVVATWPAMLKVQAMLWKRRWLSVTVMSVGLLMLLVVPLSIAITTIVDSSGEIKNNIRALSTLTVAPPPRWVTDIPVVGPRIEAGWRQLSAASSQEMSSKLVPYTNKVFTWFVSKAGSIALMIINFLVMVIIAAILYAKGETASEGVFLLVHRFAGQQGISTLTLAAKAIRGVALGVILTALIQAAIGAIGLALAGIPALVLLAGIMFLLCIAQLGPGLVLIPSVIWLYWSGQNLGGTVLLVFTIIAGTIDNFIRPVLIKKGAKLPLILIFAGVIGGLVAFGVIGLFIGPVVLGVIYTLLQVWVMEKNPDDDVNLSAPANDKPV